MTYFFDEKTVDVFNAIKELDGINITKSDIASKLGVKSISIADSFEKLLTAKADETPTPLIDIIPSVLRMKDGNNVETHFIQLTEEGRNADVRSTLD